MTKHLDNSSCRNLLDRNVIDVCKCSESLKRVGKVHKLMRWLSRWKGEHTTIGPGAQSDWLCLKIHSVSLKKTNIPVNTCRLTSKVRLCCCSYCSTDTQSNLKSFKSNMKTYSALNQSISKYVVNNSLRLWVPVMHRATHHASPTFSM